MAVFTSVPILPIVVFKDSRLKDGTPIQVCRIPVTHHWHKTYFILNAVLTYFLPFVVLTVLYIRLCRKLIPNRYYDDTTIEFHNHTHNEKLRLRWQVVNILTTIVCVFFLCHLPYRVVSIWLMLEEKEKLASMGLETYLNVIYSARLLLYLNHALNPILYNFVSTKFRMALRLLVYDKRRLSSVILFDKKKTPNDGRLKCTKSSSEIRPAIAANSYNKIRNDFRNSNDRGRINDFSPLYVKLCKFNDSNTSAKGNEMEQYNVEIDTVKTPCYPPDEPFQGINN